MLPLKALYSQCPLDCGPEWPKMCALVALSNSLSLLGFAKISPQDVHAQAKSQQLCTQIGEAGCPPDTLAAVADLFLPPHVVATAAAVEPEDLSKGDMLYLRGTGLLNTQIQNPAREFKEPEQDSHVVTVYSIDPAKGTITVVNPDRRKFGKDAFQDQRNGFFTLSLRQLKDVSKVRRLNGAVYTSFAVQLHTNRAYYNKQHASTLNPSECLFLVIDGADCSPWALPHQSQDN